MNVNCSCNLNHNAFLCQVLVLVEQWANEILRGIGNHWLWGWLWRCVCHWLRSCESPRDRKGHRSLFGLFKCRLNVFRDWLRSGVCRWSGRCHWRLLDVCNCCKLHALRHWRKSLGGHWSSVYAGTWSLAAERHMLLERRMSPALAGHMQRL